MKKYLEMHEELLKSAKRILVVGCSGSGKSTITRILADKYNLPAVHLDIHFWQPDWIATPKDKWKDRITELTNQETWVMDGTFADSFDIRFPAADVIIVISLNRFVCLYRAIKRVFQYNKVKRRPDMAEGCDESFDFQFYKYIWDFDTLIIPKIDDALEAYKSKNKTIQLKTRKDVKNFLDMLDKIK